MKAFRLLIPVLSVVILLSESACCSKIVEDGLSPIARITLIYTLNGSEVTQSFDSRPSQPEGGYQVTIPKSLDYQIMFSSKDPGCIQSMTLEKRAGNMDEHRTWIDPMFSNVSSFVGNPDCLKDNPILTYKVAAHDGKFMVFDCTGVDYAGHTGSVFVWIIPS